MIRALSLTLSLLLPIAAVAEEGPAAPLDAPTPAALVPGEGQPEQPAVAEAKHCGMHGGCGGRGKIKWVVFTGVTATVVTAIAVGIAVGVSKQQGPVPVR